MDSISKYEEEKEYYENLDKRTKEYKAWKKRQEASSKGLGDSIEKITEATGIKAAVKFLAGEDCGCDQRKEALNKMFSYKKPNCLLEDEYAFLSDLFESNTKVLGGLQKQMLINTYNRVFNERKKMTSCTPCLKSMYDQLKQYFETYQ
jgi:hypothetical protein